MNTNTILMSLVVVAATACSSDPAVPGAAQFTPDREGAAAARPETASVTLADGRSFQGESATIRALVATDGSVAYEGELVATSGSAGFSVRWASATLGQVTVPVGLPTPGNATVGTFVVGAVPTPPQLASSGTLTISFSSGRVEGGIAASPTGFSGGFAAGLQLECLIPVAPGAPGSDVGIAPRTQDLGMAHPSCAALAALR